MAKNKFQLTAIIIALLIVISPMTYADITPSGNQITLIAAVPEATKDNTIKITGTTNPEIQVTIILNQARIAELTSDSSGYFETNSITLLHENNTIQIKATDETGNVKVLTYEVKTDMTPPLVNYGTVPAGVQTRDLTITGTSTEPVTIKYKLNNTINYTSLGLQQKTFTITIPMQDGKNQLELLASDSAENTDIQNFEISYDIVKPTFESTNLGNLEPCYFDFPLGLSKKVDIRGKTSEKTTLFVYVNNEAIPSKIQVSDDDGTFRIKEVALTNKFKVQSNTTQVTLEYGDKYQNTVKIVAKDLAGNEETTEQKITCSTCGGGASGYTFTQGNLVPTSLSPKLLVQGQEMITIAFNATYRGLNKARLGAIRATKPLLAPEFADEYDNDKIAEPYVLIQKSADGQNAAGVIQIQIPTFDPLGAAETDAATFRRIENVSMHRYSRCGRIVEGEPHGCMKLFLTIEIPYQEETTINMLDPNLQQAGSKTLEKKTQTICIAPIEIDIDPTIPARFTPRGMVDDVITGINDTLEVIKKIKEPLDRTQEYTTYTCLGTTGVVTLMKLAELTTCTIGALVSQIGETPWHEEIAEIGICDDVYAPAFDKETDNGPGVKGNERARRSCNSCKEVKQLRKWLQYEVMNRVCDRVGCPSAKTFKNYIADKSGETRDVTKIITDHLEKVKESTVPANTIKEKKDKIWQEHAATSATGPYLDVITPRVVTGEYGKIFAGSDCGFTTQIDKTPPLISLTYDNVGNKQGIKSLYWATISKDKTIRDYCTDYSRAAKPECCGVEYNREWSTACGLGQIGASNIPLLDTYDELKESTCLAAQQAGKADEMSCGVLWNAFAGFCEPHTGAARSEAVYTGIPYNPMKTDSSDNMAYIFVVPQITKKEITQYTVKRGYAIKSVQYKENKEDVRYKGKSNELTQSLYEVYDGTDLTKFFQEGGDDIEKKIKEFKTELCKGLDPTECNAQRAKSAYNRVKEITGVPDQEYIVKPDSNILRSIQCICIPAVRAWVQEWETILTMMKQCMMSVQTGKGDAKVCNEFISQAICDRMYDLIKCFTSKFGAPGAGRRVTGDAGLGSIIGILTNTASDMSNTVISRYGDTGIWNALFNEKQLVKGVCMWAFTGEWDLDINTLMKESISQQTPIESTPFLGECKRYFRGFSPITQPTGLANWIYECDVILVAGADVNYRLKLQCSDDFQCKVADGFRNGECDCMKQGENTITIDAGTLKQGDYLKKKVDFTIQAGQGKGIRYDTAILEYEWENPKTKQKIVDKETQRYISQAEGQQPFEYCAFDPFTMTFRCQFGQQEGGIKIEKTTAEYDKKHDVSGIKAFPHTEPFRFGIQVKQTMPETAAQQMSAKKYLYYKIWNHVGNLVAETSPADGKSEHVFESNGDYTKPVRIELNNQLIIDKLSEKPGEKLLAWPKKDTADKDTEPSEYISTDYNITENEQSIPAIITLDGSTITAYKFRSATTGTDGFPKGDKIWERGYSAAREYEGTEKSTNNVYKFKINVNKMPDTGRIEIYLPKKAKGTDSPFDTTTPAEWKIEFTLYDTDKYGQATTQITTSPDGAIQQRQQTFKVMNNQGIELEETATAQTGQAIVQAGAQAINAVNQQARTTPPSAAPALQDPKKFKDLTQGEKVWYKGQEYTIKTIKTELNQPDIIVVYLQDSTGTILQNPIRGNKEYSISSGGLSSTQPTP